MAYTISYEHYKDGTWDLYLIGMTPKDVIELSKLVNHPDLNNIVKFINKYQSSEVKNATT